MSIDGMDFQALSHQAVTQLMEEWMQGGFTEADIQECAAQMFNMGMIACQQMQQEGAAQAQGSDQPIPYTEPMVQRVLTLFIKGLNAAVMKSHEMRLPSQEKWQFLQNCAYHVFEQSKQAMVATLGQESTPEIQIPDDQIYGWLNQTAVEALIYYVNEHEKQNGPITRLGEEGAVTEAVAPLESVEEQPVAAMQEPSQEYSEPVQPTPSPPAPQPQIIPEVHHKYAAVALLLNSVSRKMQAKILAAFEPDEQSIIYRYQNPDEMTQSLDLGRVAFYLRQFKDKLGQPKTPIKSPYAQAMAQVVGQLPPRRLESLFLQERPMVRGYIQQFTQPHAPELLDRAPYTLPPGVEESLLLYIQRNFPHETETLEHVAR